MDLLSWKYLCSCLGEYSVSAMVNLGKVCGANTPLPAFLHPYFLDQNRGLQGQGTKQSIREQDPHLSEGLDAPLAWLNVQNRADLFVSILARSEYNENQVSIHSKLSMVFPCILWSNFISNVTFANVKMQCSAVQRFPLTVSSSFVLIIFF